MVEFSPKQAATIRKPFSHTLEVNEGTPRSGKTTAGIFRAARFYIQSPDQNHLVVGYNQETAYRLFIEGDGMGLLPIFGDCARLRHDENGAHLELTTPTGIKRVYYKGGGKQDSRKAILGQSLGSVIFCEIDVIHPDMIQECFRRTFAASMRWHLADLNPPAPQHPVIRDVFDVQDTDWQHWTVADNPIITAARAEEIRKTCEKNPYLYKRDWLGQRVMPAGVIYSMFDPETHIKPKLTGEPRAMFFTGDGGQGDATSLSCNIVTWNPPLLDQPGRRGRFALWRVANYYHSGKDTGQVKAMSTYAQELRVFIQWCRAKWQMPGVEVLIDPACKSLREELHKIGIPTQPANNNGHEHVRGRKGIEVGIERAQNALTEGDFFLLDADQYGHYDFLREVGMYCRDDDGNPIDAYNHAMDDWRYGINHFFARYPNPGKEGQA